MTPSLQIYKCEICGKMTEVIHEGRGELVCCGKPMKLFIGNTVDADKEKHVPVVEVNENIVNVKVGAVPHPMEEKHFIEWIEIIADGRAYRQFLQPADSPEAFPIKGEQIVARAYCNLHGLWKN